MSEEIYCGLGNAEMFDEYMDFINYVFGFNGNQKDFKKLLPKLYKEKYDPAGHSMVVTEDGKLKAGIGAFDSDLSICGERLKVRGIGNVAVHPYSRSKGYMKICMEKAIDKMIDDGVDVTALGGRRQRYNYFSYEYLGNVYCLTVTADNVRHRLGKDYQSPFKYKKVEATDLSEIEKIKELHSRQTFHGCRDNADYYDILLSWQHTPFTVYKNDEFIGYIVGGNEDIYEFIIKDEFIDDTVEFIAGYKLLVGNTITVRIPEFNKKYANRLYDFCESLTPRTPEMFSVLNYERTTRAFMNLKAEYTDLPDGEFTFAVNGRNKYEKITISVKKGVPNVQPAGDKEPDVTLDHIECMRMLFGNYSPVRDTLPSFVKLWLPLPIYIYSTDGV